MRKHLVTLALFCLFSTSVFALVCNVPVKISSHSIDPSIWETEAKIDGRFILWQEVDTNYYPHTFDLAAFDLGADMLFGTGDDIGPITIAQKVDQGQYQISNDVVGFIKDSNVYYCTFAPGGCIPNGSGRQHFSMIDGFEGQGKSNIAIDGNVFVWSQNTGSNSPVDILVVHNISDDSTVMISPVDTNQATFIPFVKNNQVFWQEIDKDQSNFLKIHLIHYNISTGHKSILESVNYPTPFHKLESIVSYASSNIVISVIEPDASVKFYVYNAVTDRLVERVVVPASDIPVSFDNKIQFSVFPKRYSDENGFYDTLVGIKRNLTTVNLYSGPYYGTLSEPASSNLNMVFTEYLSGNSTTSEESKIKFMGCQ